MSEYMHLVGAEQVQSAGNNMLRAADRMNNVAMSIDGSLERHQRFMDDWLQRLEQVLATMTSRSVE